MEPMKPMEPMQPMKPMAPPDSSWWPEGLADPSSSGAQNGLRYAFFPKQKRLAVARDGAVELYDTGERTISGVSQADGRVGGEAVFTDASGQVDLKSLKKVQASQ